MTTPSVTVLIDTYNHQNFIEQAIVSVLEQDFPASGMEILVVDDGSTDRTPDIVRKFQPRVCLIRKANGGQASALNLGISQARGEIVAFLDGDDWWAPQKLRNVADAFEKNPGLGIVGHGYYEVNMRTGRQEQVLPGHTYRLKTKNVAGVHTYQAVASPTIAAGKQKVLEAFSSQNFEDAHLFLATSKQTVRKEVLDRILPIPEGLTFAFTDQFVSILAVAMAEGIVLDIPLCYYRLHASNLWATQDPARWALKLRILDCFVEELGPRLSELGLPFRVRAALLDPWKLESERSHLSLKGGMSWRTFRNELATYRLQYCEVSLGYRVYKAFVFALTMIMPPRWFYQLKRWYARKGFRRVREKLGDVIPSESVHVLRTTMPASQTLKRDA